MSSGEGLTDLLEFSKNEGRTYTYEPCINLCLLLELKHNRDGIKSQEISETKMLKGQQEL